MSKILVVEDNLGMLKFYELLFKTKTNHEVVLCENPNVALTMIEKGNYDLVLSDVNFNNYKPELTKQFIEKAIKKRNTCISSIWAKRIFRYSRNNFSE